MAVLSSFQVEVWAKYGVAMVIVIIRFIVRLKMVGWRNFDGTDFWCTVSAVSPPPRALDAKNLAHRLCCS